MGTSSVNAARFFQFCPRCGVAHRPIASPAVGQPFHCDTCGFHFYFSVSIAVAAILLDSDGRVLFIRRAREPAKGKLALPGGFANAGEPAEEALRREIREEVNLEIESFRYLCSAPNEYQYREITYPVLDLFFVANATQLERLTALDEVESYVWLHPSTVDLNEIAFPSIRAAVQFYVRGQLG